MLSNAVIQPFIESIEDKVRRTVDLNYYRKYDTATLTVNNPYLLPGDWEATRYVQIIDGNDDRTYLIQKDISFMNEYAPDNTSTGAATPKYYAMWDQDTLSCANPERCINCRARIHVQASWFNKFKYINLVKSECTKRAIVWLYFRSTWILERSSRYDTILR